MAGSRTRAQGGELVSDALVGIKPRVAAHLVYDASFQVSDPQGRQWTLAEHVRDVDLATHLDA